MEGDLLPGRRFIPCNQGALTTPGSWVRVPPLLLVKSREPNGLRDFSFPGAERNGTRNGTSGLRPFIPVSFVRGYSDCVPVASHRLLPECGRMRMVARS